MTAPALPEPSSLTWAIREARRMAGDRLPAPPETGVGSAEVPGTFAAAPVWSDEEWSAELGLTAELRGASPGLWHYNPYAAAAAFVLSPEVAVKRRQEGQMSEDYADPAALAADLNARAGRFAASLPRLTAELEAEAAADAEPSPFADLSLILRGY